MVALHSTEMRTHALRVVHDLGAAALLGGSLYGRLALHPAVSTVSDRRERGKIVNAAWRRYGAVNGAGLLAVVGGWAAARANEARSDLLSEGERCLAAVKGGLVLAVAVGGVATAVVGVRFSRQAPEGAVPLASGSKPAPETTRAAARLKRRLDRLGAVTTAAEVGLVAVNAALAQSARTRPPLRRALVRRSP
jgi:uncharacterized membrane protein